MPAERKAGGALRLHPVLHWVCQHCGRRWNLTTMLCVCASKR